MSSLSFRRALAALALGLVLLSPWASASEIPGRAGQASLSFVQEIQAAMGPLWGGLLRWLQNGGAMAPDRESAKNGCVPDPNGRCTQERIPTAVVAPTCENGAWVDPNGRCVGRSAVNSSCENGSSLDPFGRCTNL
jgi:hypothetical protein